MLIEFSKIWGQYNCQWNYCGGDWNFRTMAGFMEFYGIKEAWISNTETYFENENDAVEKKCFIYSGWATREIERLKKHWHMEYCNPCGPLIIKPAYAIKQIEDDKLSNYNRLQSNYNYCR